MDSAERSGCFSKPLPEPTSCAQLVALNEEFYCLGGKHWTDGMCGMFTKACACCLIFSPRTGEWRGAPPMREARYFPATCACNGKLYAFGGLKFGEFEVLSSECYNPRNNRWTILPQMPVTCHGANAVTVGDEIFICGGAVMTWPSPIDFIQVYHTVRRECAYYRPSCRTARPLP